MVRPYVVISAVMFQVARDSLNYASPFTVLSIRYLSAGFILLAVARKLILNREVLLPGLLTAASNILWFEGMRHVSPGDSAVLSYTVPLFAIPFAALFLGERYPRQGLIGALIGFVGVAAYSVTLSHGSQVLGVVLTIANAVA